MERPWRSFLLCFGILALTSCTLPSAVPAAETKEDAPTPYLKKLADLWKSRKKVADYGEPFHAILREIDSTLDEMRKRNIVDFSAQLLIPYWDMPGDRFSGVLVNNYHPSIQVIDLNGDSRLDLIVSARETSRGTTPHFYLIYINAGYRLHLALRHQTAIENSPEYSPFHLKQYTLERDESTKSYAFHTYETDMLDFRLRKFRTIPVTFRLRGNLYFREQDPTERHPRDDVHIDYRCASLNDYGALTFVAVRDKRLLCTWHTVRKFDGPGVNAQKQPDFDRHDADIWLTDSEIEKLRQVILTNRAFDLKESYASPRQELAAYRTTISFSIDGRNKSITWDGDSRLPDDVKSFSDDLLKVATSIEQDRRGR